MQVKTVELPGGNMVNVIVDKTFVFLLPITELTNIVGLPKHRDRTSKLTSITRRTGFAENIHFIVHKHGDTAMYKNLKPGSRLLTRLGMIALCTSLRTPESKLLSEWASKQTYEKLTGDNEVSRLFRSILMDISQIQAPDIRKNLRDKLKELESLIC